MTSLEGLELAPDWLPSCTARAQHHLHSESDRLLQPFDVRTAVCKGQQGLIVLLCAVEVRGKEEEKSVERCLLLAVIAFVQSCRCSL